MSDLIDRNAVINALNELLRSKQGAPYPELFYGNPFYAGALHDVYDKIKDMPSAQPEPQWIPCSERLPEDVLYIVTTRKGQVQVHVFSHNGKSEEYWMRCNKAWMPLPEPYQEDKYE